MNNKAKFLIQIFILVLFIGGCSNPKEKEIELNAKQNEKLTLSTTSRVIQLEKNPESILGYILKTNIDIPNNRIFVLSDFNIYLFDINGKFLNKLKIGKGPNEIIRIVAFTVNTDKKLIYAVDNSTRLCLFDYDGNMINSYNIKNFACTDICVLDDNNIFLLRNFVGAEEKYFVGLYNIPIRKIVKKFISAKKSPYPKYSIATSNNFSRNKGKLYLNITNIFDLFEYTDSDFQQILSFDIGKKAVPKSLIKRMGGKVNYCDFEDKVKSCQLAPFKLFGFYFKGYYFIGIDDDDLNCYAINSSNNKVYHNGALSSYFNLPPKRSLNLINGVQNDLIILNCSPSDFFESKGQETTKEIQIGSNKVKIQMEDNPFLIIIE